MNISCGTRILCSMILLRDFLSSQTAGAWGSKSTRALKDNSCSGVYVAISQAIKKHEFVHVLDSPGDADLSAYVDFAALKDVVRECEGDYTSLTMKL